MYKSVHKYDATFKEEVLKLVQNGCPVLEIAQSLSIGENLIYKWKSPNTVKEQQSTAIFKTGNRTNPLTALQGRIAVVLITQSSSVPGSKVRIEIRGFSSLGLSLFRNDPLYIVDGVPFESGNINSKQLRSAAFSARNSSEEGLSPLNAINPSDIKSIEVPEDANAMAIYGSRGSQRCHLDYNQKG